MVKVCFRKIRAQKSSEVEVYVLHELVVEPLLVYVWDNILFLPKPRLVHKDFNV